MRSMDVVNVNLNRKILIHAIEVDFQVGLMRCLMVCCLLNNLKKFRELCLFFELNGKATLARYCFE